MLAVRTLVGALPQLLEGLAPSGIVLVSDTNVAEAGHTPRAAGLLADLPLLGAPILLEPGEATKSLPTCERLWSAFLELGLDRRGLVLAQGGGVVGDVAGFAAATWLRGVRVAHLPTTLLGMVDSAVGGKTGIGFGGKNLVGAFHAPAAVLAELEALSTLPAREVRAGLAEAWKTAILAGEPLFSQLELQAAELAQTREPAAFAALVSGCLTYKAQVVADDERETSGQRALLNLGHTLGHALEFSLPELIHGEAVAIGVGFACRLAQERGLLSPALARRILELGLALGLELRPPARLDPARLLPLLARDKKAVSGRLRWVLPRGLGEAALVDDLEPELIARLLVDLGP